MASVFLSYDREDETKARSIAGALEAAGHSVWWDRHIHGGAQYSKEIENALKQADAVVVLWSERSIDSAWVRDEAAAGRDTGRLVPARLDSAEPPLGFRQYQTIELSGRKRGRSAGMAELLRAVDALGAPAPEPRDRKTAGLSALRIPPALTAGIAVATLALLALLLFQPWSSGPLSPSVTVAPGDNSPQARELAGNLLVQLGSLQAANADALQLVEPDSGADADLTFKVGALAGPGDPRAQLSLVDNQAGTLLWSREFVQPGGNQADLRQQLAYSAAQVLRCATEALSPEHPKIELATLRLYLSGCADLSNLLAQDPLAVIPTLQRVTEQAPEFAGGWGKLLLAEIDAFRRTGLKDPALRAQMRQHIRQARRIDPTMAETYLAEEWMQPPRPIIGWMKYGDEAVAKNPNHAEALSMHSLGLFHVGRLQEAVAHARRAVQVEPLSPSARASLIYALMDSGALEAARNELHQAERLWPGATNLLGARFTLEHRYGDAEEAMRILKSGRLGFAPRPALESFLEARLDPSPATIERALAEVRNAYRREQRGAFGDYVQALAEFGREEELTDALLSVDPSVAPGVVVVLFRPAFRTLHRDPRFMRVADRFGLLEYWRGSGRWPDFCSRPDLPYDCKAEAAKLAE